MRHFKATFAAAALVILSGDLGVVAVRGQQAPLKTENTEQVGKLTGTESPATNTEHCGKIVGNGKNCETENGKAATNTEHCGKIVGNGVSPTITEDCGTAAGNVKSMAVRK
jgi:hypothetical protein